jgi:hypothetical protein
MSCGEPFDGGAGGREQRRRGVDRPGVRARGRSDVKLAGDLVERGKQPRPDHRDAVSLPISAHGAQCEVPSPVTLLSAGGTLAGPVSTIAPMGNTLTLTATVGALGLTVVCPFCTGRHVHERPGVATCRRTGRSYVVEVPNRPARALGAKRRVPPVELGPMLRAARVARGWY